MKVRNGGAAIKPVADGSDRERIDGGRSWGPPCNPRNEVAEARPPPPSFAGPGLIIDPDQTR